jgi:hypothetical protein
VSETTTSKQGSISVSQLSDPPEERVTWAAKAAKVTAMDENLMMILLLQREQESRGDAQVRVVRNVSSA